MPGLGASFGRGAATNYQQDLANSDCILFMGSNMAEAHPVGFRWPMKAKERGAALIHVDPRFTRTSALCDVHVGIRAGSDVAFLGGLINYVLRDDRWFHEYVLNYTNASTIVQEGFQDTEDLAGLFSGYNGRLMTLIRIQLRSSKIGMSLMSLMSLCQSKPGTQKVPLTRPPHPGRGCTTRTRRAVRATPRTRISGRGRVPMRGIWPANTRRRDVRDAMRDLGLFVGLRGRWLGLFEERAAIRQYDGGYPREEAERLALGDTLRAMRRAVGRDAGRLTARRTAG